MFLFKKIVGPLFFPVSIGLEAMLLGLFILRFTRSTRAGKGLVTVGTAIFDLLSYSQVSSILLGPLEYRHPAVVSDQTVEGVKWIVVLGGGQKSSQRLAVTDRIDLGTLGRVLEVMADVAGILGIEKADMVLETVSKDTEGEGRNREWIPSPPRQTPW